MSYEYFYSPSRAGFYPASFKRDYENSDNDWPDDAVEIDNEYYLLLINGQSGGQRITCDDKGYPVLSESPVATKDELIALAESTKASLMAKASNMIAPLNDAVELNLATRQEQTALMAWKKYRVMLNRVDISKAPDIEWPEAPEGEKRGISVRRRTG